MNEQSYADSLRQHYSTVRKRLRMNPVTVPVIRPIDKQVEVAKEALAQIEQPQPEVVRPVLPNGPLAVREIIEAAALASGIDVEEIRGPRRATDLVRWRQAAIYLAVVLRPDLSFPAIGRIFNRDHSTVMYGFEKVSDHLSENSNLLTAILERLPADDPQG